MLVKKGVLLDRVLNGRFMTEFRPFYSGMQ